MTCSPSKSRELVVRKGRGRGRGSGRDHTPQERRVGRRPIETMTGDAYERDGSLSGELGVKICVIPCTQPVLL